MAADNKAYMGNARDPIPKHGGTPAPSTPSAAVTSPSKRELASWWKKFRKNNDRPEEKVETAPGIFGVPLAESIRYAHVAISLTNGYGESFIYGYVPIVVAKCGVFLKEKATDVEGIFRLSGSAKRIKDLQTAFNSPDRYGKGLDWSGYTVHDAANILRRYLNQLPEPLVPLDFYERFRDPLRSHQAQAVGNTETQNSQAGDFDIDKAISEYQKLITELPPLNRQLLLYILDLLAVFSSKSDLNRMTSSNLAAIFQPGIISHPRHDMSPADYRLSQDVLIFLIENQDHFLIGMTGTAVDEKTVKDVESGPPAQSPVRTPKSAIGRSASTASAGADSLRKQGVRRNASVSSKTSRDTASNGAPSPLSPSAGGAFASGSSGTVVKRSNTVPSQRSSPALPTSGRFSRQAEAPAPAPVTTAAANSTASAPTQESANDATAVIEQAPSPPAEHQTEQSLLYHQDATPSANYEEAIPSTPTPTQTASNNDRKIAVPFSRSSVMTPSDSQSKELRPPNKLKKKKRIPGSASESAASSQASLDEVDVRQTQDTTLSRNLPSHTKPDPLSTANPIFTNTAATPVTETPAEQTLFDQKENSNLRAHGSREPSLHSRSSVTDPSDLEGIETSEYPEKRHKGWRHRFSSSAKKDGDSPLAPPRPIGHNTGAALSNSSFSSSTGRPRKSFTGDSQTTAADASSTGYPSARTQSQESNEQGEGEKRGGLFGMIRAKIDESRDKRREKEAEKERAKSPPRESGPDTGSKHSLSAFAHDHFGREERGRSIDKSRDETLASKPALASSPKGEAPSAAPIPAGIPGMALPPHPSSQNAQHPVSGLDAPATAPAQIDRSIQCEEQPATAPSIVPATNPALKQSMEQQNAIPNASTSATAAETAEVNTGAWDDDSLPTPAAPGNAVEKTAEETNES